MNVKIFGVLEIREQARAREKGDVRKPLTRGACSFETHAPLDAQSKQCTVRTSSHGAEPAEGRIGDYVALSQIAQDDLANAGLQQASRAERELCRLRARRGHFELLFVHRTQSLRHCRGRSQSPERGRRWQSRRLTDRHDPLGALATGMAGNEQHEPGTRADRAPDCLRGAHDATVNAARRGPSASTNVTAIARVPKARSAPSFCYLLSPAAVVATRAPDSVAL